VIRASVERRGGRVARVSVEFPASIVTAEGSGAEPVRFGTGGGQAHFRARPQDDALDAAIRAKSLWLDNPATSLAIKLAHTDFVGIINKPQGLRLDDAVGWLRRWQAAGGVLDVKRLAFESEELSGEGVGTAHLTEGGMIEGALNVRFLKLDRFVAALESRGVITGNDVTLIKGAVGLFAQRVNGQSSVTLPVRLRDGQVHLGPVKVATLPPVM
jgi:hypothetical protein